MEIVFTLESGDLITIQRYYHRQSNLYKGVEIFALTVIFLVSFYQGFHLKAGVWISLGASFSFMLAYWILWEFWMDVIRPCLCKPSIPKGKNNGILGEHKIQIDQQGIVESTQINESHFLWRGIAKVTQNNQYIFIFINSDRFHAIPKRSFANYGESKKFYELAKKYHRKAQIEYN